MTNIVAFLALIAFSLAWSAAAGRWQEKRTQTHEQRRAGK